MTDSYREDLAYIHDAGFGQFARNAASVLLEHFRSVEISGGLVVDLGCGSGILAQEVCEAGYEVFGIDLSADLITIARTRVPQAEFHVGSFFDVPIPPCIAVTAIGECFNYLFDQDSTTPALLNLFQRIFDALCPGGLFMFDVAEPGRVPTGTFRTYTEGEDWAVLMNAEEDKRHRCLTRHITTFRRVESTVGDNVKEFYRRDRETHRLRLFDREELIAPLETIGFWVQSLDRYGTLFFGSGHQGVLAQKPCPKRQTG